MNQEKRLRIRESLKKFKIKSEKWTNRQIRDLKLVKFKIKDKKSTWLRETRENKKMIRDLEDKETKIKEALDKNEQVKRKRYDYLNKDSIAEQCKLTKINGMIDLDDNKQ